MFTDSRVSRRSGFRAAVTPGTNAARRCPIAHKVKPDQVEAYKKAALVQGSVTHLCI